MDEQDLMIREKIKKREKTDIMLAYMLIVILLGCILFIVYMKFIKKDNNNVSEPTEYVANYIKLEDIASNINNNLNTKYSGINVSSSDNGINVSYGDLTYDIKLINNELVFNMDNDNKVLFEDIYKDIVTSICIYYNNDVDGCKNAANSITFGNNVTGIRFIDNTMYISIVNSISPIDVSNNIYTEETIIDIDNTDYELQLNNKTINNIKVDILDTNIIISGDISNNGRVTVKLYDNDSNLLEEKTTNSSYSFSINFDYNYKLNIDSIKRYSISVE